MTGIENFGLHCFGNTTIQCIANSKQVNIFHYPYVTCISVISARSVIY